MTGKTISEKILSLKSGTDARAGDLVVCDVDCALGTDGSTPMALDYFASMGGTTVRHSDRLVFALDHYVPPSSPKTKELHRMMQDFAKLHGIALHEAGEGIGHQLIVETGRALPGSLVVGADSHAVTYGALNSFATGIGSSDLAAIMLSGQIWLRVPSSIRVTLTGLLSPGVYPKDIALTLAGLLRADGAAYQALEFAGDGVAALDLEDRLVLSNLAVEMGAKNGIFPADAKTAAYLAGRTDRRFEPVAADADAVYAREIALDLDTLVPQVALPHLVDQVVALGTAAQAPVHMVFLGTCTGGRLRDFHQARDVLVAGGGVAPGVQLVVTPASREVLEAMQADGTYDDYIRLGATIVPPGCGACCGTCGVIPGDGVNVVSTANRNFKGRMGNGAASIYLASPASCAAAAVSGTIGGPS
ncbi:MAG TPA: aconitase/3-isopropylmalate dehydratase large subunit family protein [Aliidongia sp.]|uniref:aconitase/3-isopropylmalate dehydratase large subunit family protein n=1 Tax=Aliidongia sp. TaxID=1914230 RepID=UPI002DDCEB8E|nr:aconitase/3-isopropylmalate dehydratase large subunit family protein [Aliidongia sp.]HEV2674785.1 aconitase/3-isopropylmalate dehydratase large subunit family protein [Aliidongia sp.]